MQTGSYRRHYGSTCSGGDWLLQAKAGRRKIELAAALLLGWLWCSGVVYATPPWHAGLLAGAQGFATPLMGEGEYARVGLHLDSFPAGGLRPSFRVEGLMQVNPWQLSSAAAGIGVELQYTSLEGRAPVAVFQRPWRWSPALGASFWILLTGGQTMQLLEARLLRFWFGDSILSLLSPSVVLDANGAVRGWGLSVFEWVASIW
ncbi:MAG: hypothetical protein QHH01_02780 [Spirochaetales bacterium]|nr:hypothetical protein [Spirochaetales bacterium]